MIHVSFLIYFFRKRRRLEVARQKFNEEKYKVLEPCPESCRMSCNEKLSEEIRKTINFEFWKLNFSECRLWFDAHILIQPIKRRKSGSEELEFLCSYSYIYQLPVTSHKVPVCKTMFLSTLGLKTDGRITEFIRQKLSNQSSVLKDGRGKSTPCNKIDEVSVQDHIESFNPQVSHYNLENAPQRRYLDPDLSVVSMWKDYQAKGFDVSYSLYQREFHNMNIGFARPSQDDCKICLNKALHKDNLEISGHDKLLCSECRQYQCHENRYKRAREEYKKDTELIDKSIFATDMQKIILLPKMTTKEHFFVSRLVVFNQTFASLQEHGDFVVLWHEGTNGRLAADVASAYIKCITLAGKDRIVFWADNCSGQNKNWVLYTALTWCVNQEWGPKSVTIKYLEKGHTFMRADSVHGSIAIKMKKKTIHTFDDFVQVCQEAGKKIKPVAMHYSDFYKFVAAQKSRQSKKTTLPKLSQICEVEFRKGTKSMHFKHSFDDPSTEVEILKQDFVTNEEPAKLHKPRGLSQEKKKDILSLISTFPASKKKILDGFVYKQSKQRFAKTI